MDSGYHSDIISELLGDEQCQPEHKPMSKESEKLYVESVGDIKRTSLGFKSTARGRYVLMYKNKPGLVLKLPTNATMLNFVTPDNRKGVMLPIPRSEMKQFVSLLQNRWRGVTKLDKKFHGYDEDGLLKCQWCYVKRVKDCVMYNGQMYDPDQLKGLRGQFGYFVKLSAVVEKDDKVYINGEIQEIYGTIDDCVVYSDQ